MAVNPNDRTRGGRRAPGRAPGVFRTVGNPLYRTNPTTGNLELVSEFEVPLEAPAQRPLPPVPPPPIVQPPVVAAPVVEPEPEPVPPPAPAPSPLSGIFASDDGRSTETDAPAPTDTSASTEALGTGTTSTSTASRNTGIGQNVGMGLGATIGGIPGAVAGAVVGDMVETGIRGMFGGDPVAGPQDPGWNDVDQMAAAAQTNELESAFEADPAADAPANMGVSGESAAPGANDDSNASEPGGDPSSDRSDADAEAASSSDGGSSGDTSSSNDAGANSGNDDSNSGEGGGSGSGEGNDAGGDSGGDSGGDDDGGGDGFAHGGFVTPERLQGPNPPGPDDGYGGLDAGEFVVNAQAAQQNAGLLESMNAQGTAQGVDQGGPELETLRWFRENVLTRTPQGQQLLAHWEQAAPEIARGIAQRPDGAQVMQSLLNGYVLPAAEAVRRGQFDEAVRIYAEMGTVAAELAAEAELDPAVEQALEEFAQEAAEVTHDGELAQLATATGGELVHPGEQVANQPQSRLGRIFVGG